MGKRPVGIVRYLVVVLFFVIACSCASAATPVPDFSASPLSGPPPLAVSFSDASSGSPVSWSWFFGDELFTQPWVLKNASPGWSKRTSHAMVVMPDGSLVLMGGHEINYAGGAYLNDTWRSNDNGVTWTRVNASSGWTARYAHSSVVTTDGSIVLTGGYDGTSGRNDTWRSTDYGATWVRVNASSGWSMRFTHSSVAMPDGSIVLFGGDTSANDTWRSTDSGVTWVRVNANAGWETRRQQTGLALPDGSILMSGGNYGSTYFNDTWRSADNGGTWVRINASSGWSGRMSHSLAALPDNTILLMGGTNFAEGLRNDTWRSTDNGATWALVNASPGWAARHSQTSTVLHDGSILLAGGSFGSSTYANDVWRFSPQGSNERNPSHIYTAPGIYPVALMASNGDGSGIMRKDGYVTITSGTGPPIAAFSANVTSGPEPLAVRFTDSSYGSPSSWYWSFGDGTYSALQNPEKIYSGSGNYTVSLNVTNGAGYNTLLRTGYINVSWVNHMPVVSDVLLASTSGLNRTSDNLHMSWNVTDPDTQPIRNITNWYRNGTTIMSLNMPFEGGSNGTWTKDYSGLLHNGTVYGAAWNATGGPDGSGAYYFNGSNVIDTGTFNPPDPAHITLSAWVYPQSGSENYNQYFLTKGNDATDNSYGLSLWSSSPSNIIARLTVYRGGAGSLYITSTPVGNISYNTWHHVAGTINGTVMKIYLDGQYQATYKLQPEKIVNASAQSVYIGGQNRGSYNYRFKGNIDDPAIYNRVLSPEQINALYQKKKDLLVPQELQAGDSWQGSVTPNDGISDGITEYSNLVNITPAAPVASFTANTTYGTAPLPVAFTDTSTSYPVSWNWSFGDGSMSTLQNPTHTYTGAGTYTVSLNVTNSAGSNVTTRTAYVSVSSGSAAMFQADPFHTGVYQNGGLDPRNQLKWKYASGSEVSTGPVVLNSTAYYGDKTGRINAVYAANGTLRWSYTTGGSVFSTPAIADGILFAGSNDKNVYALDAATGAKIWNYTTGGSVVSSPTVANGVVYIGSDDGKVYALNAGSGAVLWSTATSGYWNYDHTLYVNQVESSPAVANGNVYVANAAGYLYAMNTSTGNIGWSFRGVVGMAGTAPIYSSPVVGDGVVFIGTEDYYMRLYALDAATGAERWNITKSSTVHSVPVISSGTLYFQTWNQNLYAVFASNGTQRWSASTGTAGSGGRCSPILSGNFLYLGTDQGYLKVFSASTGALMWQYSARPIYYPAAVSEGVVYFGDYDGNVYALGGPTAGFSADTTSGEAPLTVRFTDATLGSPSSWNWTFGDGNATNATAQSPVHTYSLPGTYTVTLQASNIAGSNSTTKTSLVAVYPLTAAFTADRRTGYPPLAVQFTDLSTRSPTAWNWSFGDGNFSSVKNPSYTYPFAGSFNVTLTATNALGSNTTTQQAYIQVYDWGRPLMDFTASPLEEYAPAVIQFNDTSLAPVSSWLWNFGDGGSSTLQNATHTYQYAGDYAVRLTGTTPAGTNFTQKEAYVKVYPTEIADAIDLPNIPTSSSSYWSVSPDSGYYRNGYATISGVPDDDFGELTADVVVPSGPDANLEFTWGVSSEEASDILSFTLDGGSMDSWSGDNSGTNTYSLSSGSHTLAWRYTKDNNGAFAGSDSAWVDHVAITLCPVANFTANATTGNPPLAVQFNDTSTNGVPDTWFWDFGDGNTSDEKNPVNTYVSPGTYTVRLDVSNGSLSSYASKAGYIVVGGGALSAGFTGTPVTGIAPLAVQFNDTSTGSPTAWNWSFGDGSVSSIQNATHTYTTAGTYTVSLNTSSASGYNVSTRPNYIRVTIPPPIPGFSANATSGTVPLTVAFTDSSTGGPTGWAWFFGDEGYNQSWIQMNGSAAWSPRGSPATVRLSDGSIILTGGAGTSEVWRSGDLGATWTLVNGSAGWPGRYHHTSVVTPGGHILVMGGWNGTTHFSDVWRSRDAGATWTVANANAGWAARRGHSTVALPDGSVLLMGGNAAGTLKNDVWQSADNGTTWTEVTSGAAWSPRTDQAAVVKQDGRIFLMGGWDGSTQKSDVWVSSDNGMTWTIVTSDAGWEPREAMTSIVMPDTSILVMGGYTGGNKNDVWRSTDNGVTWARVNASAGWAARRAHNSVQMPDGSIILLAGNDGSSGKNDIWRFQPAGSILQNPIHTYADVGNYTVALQVRNAGGPNSTRKNGYVNVTSALSAPVASFSTNVTSGIAPLTVQFTDASINSPTAWNWSFGDGGISSVQNATHTYTSPGIYTISLNASSTAGYNVSTQANYIRVTIHPPIPGFSANLTSGTAPLSVQFTDSSAGTVAGQAWFFGDETYSQSWTLKNASAAWGSRYAHSTVVMPDNSIILTGGYDGSVKPEVWRSTDSGITWKLVNNSPGWSGRHAHSMVVMPDTSIILMGGFDGSYRNDVWRSTDSGATWSLVNASAGWSGREFPSTVVLPGGVIVLTGGGNVGSGIYLNDVWQSADYGRTWAKVNDSPGWSGRLAHSTVVMPDNSIVLMAGDTGSSVYANDTWRSSDSGVTWSLVNASPGWSQRYAQTAVVMPDNSLLLMGGHDRILGNLNDTWQSTDNGASWTKVNGNAQWRGRAHHSAVVMPDSSVILTGGYDTTQRNDVWQLQPAGSSVQNPVHTYTSAGNYSVALQTYNAGGFNSTRKIGYISVISAVSPPVASLSANRTSGTAPLTVQFNDTSTGSPTSWNWSFGDGSFSSAQNVTHTFATTGAYTVNLSVSNSAGSNVTSQTRYILVDVASIVTGRSDREMTGKYNDGGIAPTGKLRWSVPLAGGDTYYGVGMNPTVWNGTVYVESRDGKLYAINTSTGSLNWVFTTDSGSILNEFLAENGPTIADGVVYFGDCGNYVYAVNAINGTRIWKSPVLSENIRKPVIPAYGFVYALDEASTSHVYALDAVTGKIVWTYTATAGTKGPLVTKGSVIISEYGVGFRSLNATTGTTNWVFAPAYGWATGGMAVEGDIVYASNDNFSGAFFATNGTQIWTNRYAADTPNAHGLAIAYGLLYKQESNPFTSSLWAWNMSTGALAWKTYSYTMWGGQSGPAIANGTAYIGISQNGPGTAGPFYIRAINATTGDVLWTVNAPQYLMGSPAVSDGMLFITGSGNLYAYGGPLSNFTANATTGSAPLSVQFTDTSLGSPTSWNWSFGDGTVSTSKNPVHTYSGGGSFNVTLNATGSLGSDIKTVTYLINVTGSAPVASFTANITSGAAPLAVHFTDTSTSSPTAWNWSFGDGTVSTVQNATHTYSTAGTYTVSLNATNAGGYNVSTWTNYIHVTIPRPIPKFSANATSGSAPLPVQFTDASSGTITGRAWFFGDELYSQPWTLVNASAGWTGRLQHTIVVLPDGSLVIMGGAGSGGNYMNDTWRSTDNGVTWMLMNASSGWMRRYGHTSVVMPDGSIVLMGGSYPSGSMVLNDTWRSTDMGVSWTLVNESSGWVGRFSHTSVVMPDGSIVLMGGYDNHGLKRDVWRSTDNGATWTQVNAGADWSARRDFSSAVMPDGSIILTGGFNLITYLRDVWRSTDNGATWTQVNASADWSARRQHSSFAMPDGSLVLMGGGSSSNFNDLWRSTDNGATWSEVNASAGWEVRRGQGATVLPDGSILLTGGVGDSFYNDVWRISPIGSSVQNPEHTYLSAGNYTVALQVYNSGGFNSTKKIGYVNVTEAITAPVAGFSANRTSGTLPFTVAFNDVSAGSPTAWNWSFGDGSFSDLQNVTHTYASVGTYTVSLNATNSGGYNVSTRTNYIHVTIPRPIPKFSANATSGNAPLAVQFTDASSGTITGHAWFFGDETYSQPWTLVNGSAGWSGREWQSSVAMPDGSIILTGGYDGSYRNDTWRSTDNGATWTLMNASSGWIARRSHSIVVTNDSSLVLMGGYDGSGSTGEKNDVWRSVDYGATWAEMTPAAGWSARNGHASVVLPDGSIILFGGFDFTNRNHDVWKSSDYGATWSLVNPGALWAARDSHTSVVMPDGSIVMMGGSDGINTMNDTWRSADHGATWTQMTAHSAWTIRAGHASVVLPGGSILLAGGTDGAGWKNDVWQSGDNGVTWTQVNASAGWTPRYFSSMVQVPDGSMILAGGNDGGYRNDTWRFQPAGSSLQNPVHTYTSAGNYSVALQAYNTGGFNSTRKFGYINVTLPVAVPSAAFTSWMTTGPAPLTIQFMDTSTGSPTGWSWDFGDGDSTNATVQNPLHTFASLGTYTVTLNATNSGGYNVSTRANYIAVRSPRPRAAFLANTTSGTAPLSVEFTDSSSGTVTGRAWYFGDETYTQPWMLINGSAGWDQREGHSIAVMPDGTLILTGGNTGGGFVNDTWRSDDNGSTWSLVNPSSGWAPRVWHSTIVMPDSSIVLTGGEVTGDRKNDVWRSVDYGTTWTLVNASAEWSPREFHNTVRLSDHRITLIGGYDGGLLNDTWQSADNGVTWTMLNDSSGWTQRHGQASLVMPDGAVILMGGASEAGRERDVWRSADGGATWSRVTANASWSARERFGSAVMPEGTILVLGGEDGSGRRNDIWKSADAGATWSIVNDSAGWSGRQGLRAAVLPGGSLAVIGGYDGGLTNDVWRFNPAGSSLQNPVHTYTSAGNYTVALLARNNGGFNSTRKTGYISVMGGDTAPVASFTATITSGTVPLTIFFNDTSIHSPTAWNWSFGDGAISNLQNVSHTYASAGTYTVSLNASNAGGSNVSTRTNYITVRIPAPVPAFSANSTSGTAPLPVQFTDSSAGTVTGRAWFFGDEPYSEPWVRVNASAGWTARYLHSSIVKPEGTLVLMGGFDDVARYNDVWQSVDNGTSWTRVNTTAEWTPRYSHSSVVLPDGSILLMGGSDGIGRNDVWRSTDNGAVWTQVTPGAGWSPREGHSSVVLPDGSIVLMGGVNGAAVYNDVWRSTDNGATWTQVKPNDGTGWAARWVHTSVVMPDGSILLMGGLSAGGVAWDDVWRSTDSGATWTPVTPGAGWAARWASSSVVMPDGSIVLTGGYDGSFWKNDVWQLRKLGNGWTQVNASAGWAARHGHSTVSMPDGSMILIGGHNGGGNMNDVWRLQPAGSTLQNPAHTYTSAGNYTVALQTYNTGGFNSTRKIGYINVTGGVTAPVASFTSDVTTGTAPLSVQFNDTSTYSPTAWNWSFGDGQYSNVQNLTHTYVRPGIYTVSLNATNAGGSNTTVLEHYILADYANVSMFRSGPKHHGVYPAGTTPPGPGLLWKYQTPGEVLASPVYANGTLYFGSTDSKFYALHAETGTVRWTFDAGGQIQSSPAVAGDLVYFGCDNGKLYALYHSNGTERWNVTTGGKIFSSPTPSNGLIIFGSEDKKIYAVNAWTGTVMWYRSTTDVVHSSPAVSGSTVYIGGDSNLYALNIANGTEQWNSTTGGFIQSSPTIAGGRVFVGSHNYTVHAFDAGSGAPFWAFPTGHEVRSSPAVDSGVVYVGSSDDWTYAINAGDGSLKWRYRTGAPVLSSPSVAGDYVYFGSYDWNITALYKNNGTRAWSYRTGYEVRSSPIIVNDTLYIGGIDGAMYALRGGIAVLPATGFTSNTTFGLAPLAVQFNDTSAGSPTSWNWSFGDGTYSTVQNASHTYTLLGKFNVSLTATNSGGSNTTALADYVSVSDLVADFSWSCNATVPYRVDFRNISTTSFHPITSLWWDFGDGATDIPDSANPMHTYANASPMFVNLQVWDSMNGGNSTNRTVTPCSLAAAPGAAFISNTTYGLSPLAVQFNDTSAGSPTSWNWSFGDGTYSTVQNASHTYTLLGKFNVSLTATNAGGSNVTVKTDFISVSDLRANFTWSCNATVPYRVDFRNTSTTSFHPLTSLWWDFGDGATDIPDSANPMHTYANATPITVNLQVWDSMNGGDSINRTVIPCAGNSSIPLADFSGSPAAGTVPLSVTFSDLSANFPTIWNWSFGDGNFSTVRNPTYTYMAAGNYTVSLKASNAFGNDTRTRAGYISVSAPVTSGTGTIINQSARIYLGEEGLNVTHALNQAQGSADINGVPVLTTIGWWSSRGFVGVVAPSRTVNLAGRHNSLVVSPADFAGNTGPWYLLQSDGVSLASPMEIFTVDDPVLDIRIWDVDHNTNVTSGTVSRGTRLGFRIDTNLNNVTVNRTPLTPATDGFVTIKVKNASGTVYSSLYNDSVTAGPLAGPRTLIGNYVSAQPFFWGSPSTHSWFTDARDSGSARIYPDGVYTVTAESTLNHMMDNYKLGTAYYTGKTISPSYTVTIGTPAAPVVDFALVPSEGTVPVTVQFTDMSAGSPVNWNWSFGDGSYSDSQNPTHTFTEPKVTNVTLKAWYLSGLTNSTMRQVTGNAVQVSASTAIEGTSMAVVNDTPVLTVNTTAVEESGGTVTTTNTTVTITGANDFWQTTEIYADSVTVNETTQEYTATNTTQVVLQSTPVTAELNETIGTVSVALDVALKQVIPDTTVNITITQGATTSTASAFQLAASNAGIAIQEVAYTVELKNTEVINNNLTQNATRKSRAAIMNMSVNHGWVAKFRNSTNDDGRLSVAIIRYPENGVASVLPTRFIVYDNETKNDWFEADSVEGFSIFGMIGYAAQETAASQQEASSPPSNSYSYSSSSDSADNRAGIASAQKAAAPPAPPAQKAPPAGIPVAVSLEKAALATDKTGHLTAEVQVQSVDKAAVLSMPQDVKATDKAGQPLAEVSIRPDATARPLADTAQFTYGGIAYHCGPDGAQFDPAIKITFTLTKDQWDALTANGREPVVRSFSPTTGAWETLQTTTDPSSLTVTADVIHFSSIAVFSRPAQKSPTAAASVTEAPAAISSPAVPVPKPTKPPANAFEIVISLGSWLTKNIVILALLILLVPAGYVGIRYYRKKKQYDSIIYGKRR